MAALLAESPSVPPVSRLEMPCLRPSATRSMWRGLSPSIAGAGTKRSRFGSWMRRGRNNSNLVLAMHHEPIYRFAHFGGTAPKHSAPFVYRLGHLPFTQE